MFYRAILSAGIHALQQDEQRMAGVRIEQLLQFANPLAQALRFFARLVLIQSLVVVRVEILQSDRRGDFDRLAHIS